MWGGLEHSSVMGRRPKAGGGLRGGFRFHGGATGAMGGCERRLSWKASGQEHFSVVGVFLRLRSCKAPPPGLPSLTLEVQSYG